MNSTSLEKHVLSIVCSVFDAYSATLFLPSEDGGGHYLAACFSLGDNIRRDATVYPGQGLVGWILDSRERLVTNFDRRKHTLGYYAAEAEEGIKAFMGVPVPTGGALCVDSKRQYSFSEKDVKILRLFAELVARQQTLGHSDLAGDIPRYFAELGVIQDLRFRYKRWPAFLKNFLRNMKDATEFDYCAFASLQEGRDYYHLEGESSPLLLGSEEMLRIPLGTGIAGWVFYNEQPVFEGEARAPSSALFGKLPDMPEFSAFICMPVMIDKACRGVLCLASAEPRQIDESLRSFVRQAVDHLGLFLENIYLKSRLGAFYSQATLQREGGRVYNPDRAPAPRQAGDDEPE